MRYVTFQTTGMRDVTFLLIIQLWLYAQIWRWCNLYMRPLLLVPFWLKPPCAGGVLSQDGCHNQQSPCACGCCVCCAYFNLLEGEGEAPYSQWPCPRLGGEAPCSQWPCPRLGGRARFFKRLECDMLLFGRLGCDMLLFKRLECDMLLFKRLECDLSLFKRLGCDMLLFELPTECQHM